MSIEPRSRGEFFLYLANNSTNTLTQGLWQNDSSSISFPFPFYNESQLINRKNIHKKTLFLAVAVYRGFVE